VRSAFGFSFASRDVPGYTGKSNYRKGVHIMNWDQLTGQWKQMQGSVKEKWGKLTDDDLTQIAGKRDQFIGKVQERYGIAKEEAQRRVDEWMSSQGQTQRPAQAR
jgi:uncharacterized protein YjbJ (UPF0337 family)